MKGKNFKSIVIAVLALCVIGSFSAVPVFAEELPEPVFSMNGHVRDLSEVGEGFEEAKEENISGIVFKNGGSALYEDFDSVKLDLSKPFSVSFFIKVNTSSLSCIFAKNDKVSGHAELYIDGNGTVCFYSPDVNSNNPVYWDLTGVTVNDGALHHVAMTYDGEVMKFYNNGILLNTWYSVSGPIANVACDMLSIGACNDGSLPLDGFIGDLRFYDTVLTDGQVALLDAEREEGDKDIVEVKDPVLLDTIIPDGMAVENGVAEGNLINDFSHNLGNTFTLSASFKTSCKEPFQVLFAKHAKDEWAL